MRRRALQAGRIYVRQHPGDAQLTVLVDELRDMVGHREGDTFSSRVVRYASSIRGTKLYWFQQQSRLLSMVDTLGLPTIFFTHSAADLQWPELARLLCPDNPESPSSRKKAVIQNPAIADWFFHHRILKFVQVFYVSILGATDYWMRFEWQHRGSPHVHGLAWLPDAPEKLLSSSPDNLDNAKQIIAQYADRIVSTCNCRMEATLTMRLLHGQIHTYAIRHTMQFKTSTGILWTLWRHASDTLGRALPPTVSGHAMGGKNVALDTQRNSSQTRPWSLKMERVSQHYSLHAMTA